nr:glucose n-acetyltransferase 1 [Quercus suber]
MFNRWKDDVTGFMTSRWSYASVGNDGKDYQQSKTWRQCLASKTLWRLLIATTLLLATVAIVFSPPARATISRHVWTKPSEDLHDVATDWSQYAYCQYVTNEAYLCNSMMIFESLTRLGARADRLMMYPEDWVVGDSSSVPGRLLAKARDEYGVKLVPITVQHFVGEPTWADSFTKLLAFNQTQYKRVLSLDSDATVLQVGNLPVMKRRNTADPENRPWTSYFFSHLLQSLCLELTGWTIMCSARN